MADATAASSDGVGASMTTRCPCSIQNAHPATRATTIARSSFDNFGFHLHFAVGHAINHGGAPSMLVLAAHTVNRSLSANRPKGGPPDSGSSQTRYSGTFVTRSGSASPGNSRSPDNEHRQGPAVPYMAGPSPPRRRPSQVNPVHRRMIGDQRQVNGHTDQIEDGTNNGKSDREGLELG